MSDVFHIFLDLDITWQSMGQSQGFHPKYLKLWSEDEQSFTGLERHEGKWNILGWSIPLKAMWTGSLRPFLFLYCDILQKK